MFFRNDFLKVPLHRDGITVLFWELPRFLIARNLKLLLKKSVEIPAFFVDNIEKILYNLSRTLN